MNRISKYGVEQVISVVIVIAVIAIFLVYVVGAGVNSVYSIGEGVIVDKRISSITNQKIFCPNTSYFPIAGETRGTTVRYTFEVTEGEYETHRIGDWYER